MGGFLLNLKRKAAAFLFAAVLFLALSGSGCATVRVSSSDGLLGTWKDAYGLTEYRFEPGGQMKLKALNVGHFKGTYRTEGNRIAIRYRVLGRDVSDTYTIRLEGNTMYLDGDEFIRRE